MSHLEHQYYSFGRQPCFGSFFKAKGLAHDFESKFEISSTSTWVWQCFGVVMRASGPWRIPKFPFTPPATFWDFRTGLAHDFVSTLEIFSVFVYGKNTLRSGFWHSFGVVTSTPGPFKYQNFDLGRQPYFGIFLKRLAHDWGQNLK